MPTPKLDEASIFNVARRIEETEARQRYIAQMCGTDQDARARIEALLRVQDEDRSFLESPAAAFEMTTDSPRAECVGTEIGPYKLLEQIGEGGMGTVWMAQQTEPVKRAVALKLIKAGMDSRQVIARFEAERQALALMDHSNIARVLDAGTTDNGRPYFVMDLVKGVPITKYCDEHHLTPRQRLELFVPVCQAIQHAHQKGIIHRDIKPSNVMVTLYDGKPVPKVIDFGVAKATEQKLTERTLFTQYGTMVGTLEYMSPEQAEMSALGVDTRSDIYSLGVLLYELLTGSTPLTRQLMKEAAYGEILRMIKEEEPPKPSTRLSDSGEALASISAQRHMEPAKLTKLVRGELDSIVMKALEKDRNRRYEAANAFAQDVQRYLVDEPVQACPPSAGYKLRKFGRKYRTALNIAAVVVTLLVAAVAISAWQAVRATLAEQQAVAERDRAEASFRMAREVVDRFFTQVSENPELKGHAMEKFRKELLQNAKEFYERFIREQLDVPSVRHDLGLAHYRLAKIQEVLGDFAAAQTLSEKAIEILRELTRAHPEEADYQRDLAASYFWLGVVYFDTDRLEMAESAYQQGVEIQERLAGEYPDVGDYRHALALTHMRLGDLHYRAHQLEGARANQERALSVWTKLAEDKTDISDYQHGLATIKGNLGETYGRMGLSEKAETVLKEAQSAFQTLVHAHPDVPDYRQSLGRTCRALGYLYHDNMREPQKAEAAAQQALQIFEQLAQEHPHVLEYVHWAGVCYAQLGLAAELGGRPDAALARYDKAIEILERVVARGYGAARIFLVDSRIYRAALLPARGEHARAVEEAEAVGKQEGLNGPNYYNIACVFSRSSAAAGSDAKLSPADRTRLTAQYAGRAMDFLRQAVANGLLNLPAIKSDPDLAPLRSREDYKKLVQELESKQKPAEK